MVASILIPGWRVNPEKKNIFQTAVQLETSPLLLDSQAS
jgi:hypothetical protein